MVGGGFVLTGGQSSRMGRDKALLPYRGATLVEWVAGLVREAAGSVTLVGGPERYASLGFPCLTERYSGCGPLSGIEAALRLGGAEWSLIVACDMPALDAAWLGRLFESAPSSGADAVLAADSHGRPQPLCGVYHTSVQTPALCALESGDFAVRNLLNRLHVVHFPADVDSFVLNANTAEEWGPWSR